MPRSVLVLGLLWLAVGDALGQQTPSLPYDFSQLPLNAWVKLSPQADTPASPRLGYEGACAWDAAHQVLIRYGGHNQGGGGEQGSEIWTFEPKTACWTLKEPNTSPPGICCGQQNVFDPVQSRYLRFPAFSASHGWQWLREVYLNDASVWTYSLETNTWRNLRPLPAAHPRPLRCASWDSEHQVVVMFGGEGAGAGTWIYDPWTNEWTKRTPPGEPNPRSGGNMAYDAQHKLHVMFGSQFDNDTHTWAYDLNANAWRDLKPAESPPTDKNDAVLTYDSAAGLVVAIVKISSGKDEDSKQRLETWTYSVADNAWRKMDPPSEPDPTGNRARQLLFAPQLGVTLLENRPGNVNGGGPQQQIWAYRLESPSVKTVPLAAPRQLAVEVKQSIARLTWRPPEKGEVASYVIYRGQGEQPQSAQPGEVKYTEHAKVAGNTTIYEDIDLESGVIYCYYLTAIDREGREGAASLRVRTQPRAIDQLVVTVIDAQRVELSWQPPLDSVVSYEVERAPVEVISDDQLARLKAQTPPLESPSVAGIRRVGEFKRLTGNAIAATTFIDTTVDLNRPDAIEGNASEVRKFSADQLDTRGRGYRHGVYAYRVRAINDLGVVGGTSPAVLTIPSSPTYVFAKEEGTTCHLKWEVNPERGLRGYRVYRMDGRYDKDPVKRLNAEPISERTLTDPEAGKPARRYYVVAVDALGQEGFPSSPAWFNREWKSFYKPFTGEWHQ